MSSKVNNENLQLRKRGRPTGKRRIPLSLDQRRARNAQYERERRNETAEAIVELAKAANLDASMSNNDLLMIVIDKLQKAAQMNPKDDIEDLKRSNDTLISQIETLEKRLNNDCTDSWTAEHCNPKKKLKLKTENEISIDVPFSWTPNKVAKSHVKSEFKQTNTGEIEQVNKSYSHKIKLEPDEDEAFLTIEMKTRSQTCFAQNNCHPGPSKKIVPQYGKMTGATNYYTHKKSSAVKLSSQGSSQSRYLSQLPSVKIENNTNIKLTQAKEDKIKNILNLLTDNEKGLFGDIEWLTDCEYTSDSSTKV